MNATGTPTSIHASSLPACDRYVVKTACSVCEVRARTVAPIADVLEVLGLETELDLAAEGLIDSEEILGWAADGGNVADLLDSRMIAPPRLRRRQRAVSSRAVFYGRAAG